MIFVSAADNENYVGRFVSSNGRWELGWMRRTFGRLQLGFNPVGAWGATVEYCCGDSLVHQAELLQMVRKILEKYPENVTEIELYKAFPRWDVRPIYNDPVVWGKLQAMAKEAAASV